MVATFKSIIKRYGLSALLIVISLALFPLIGVISAIGILLGFLYLPYQEYMGAKREEIEDKRHKEIKKELGSLKSEAKIEKVYTKVRETIKNRDISLFNIFKKLNKPIHSILIQKYFEQNSQKKEKQIIIKNLDELGFINLQSGVRLLNPSRCPEINEDFDIKRWVQDNVLKGVPKVAYKYIINFATVIDLRYSWSERVIAKKGRTLFELLEYDQNLLANILVGLERDKVTLKKIIKESSIDFLIEKDCSPLELEKINNENENILKKLAQIRNLNNVTILDIFMFEQEDIERILTDYSSNANSLAIQLKENSQFWNNFLQ